jgi:hypothetical protein
MNIHRGRFTSQGNDALVVFHIGMRINRYWRIDEWIRPAMAMQRMIGELQAEPALGLLEAIAMKSGARIFAFLQYWRDFDSLEAYASDPARLHFRNWRESAIRMAKSDTVGFYHETYCIPDGSTETIYINMPDFGLGKVRGTIPVTGGYDRARERMGSTDS